MLLRAGRHPSLVAWHGWWVDAAGRLCLLLQRCEGGALEGLLKVRPGLAAQRRWRQRGALHAAAEACWLCGS